MYVLQGHLHGNPGVWFVVTEIKVTEGEVIDVCNSFAHVQSREWSGSPRQLEGEREPEKGEERRQGGRREGRRWGGKREWYSKNDSTNIVEGKTMECELTCWRSGSRWLR